MDIPPIPPLMPPPMQPPSRRPYKRVSPQQWEQQKDRIYELFIDQDKTHEEVIEILKEQYGFDIGVRQLKRKTDEWGFVKNIPKGEMQKMVRKRKIRQDDLGKGTQFKRRHGAGEFQDVSQERLDRFERRFVLTAATTMSISTGTPSNIVYHTPSNNYGTPRSNDPNTSRVIREATIEFNDSVEDIFSNGVSSAMGRRANPLNLSIGGLSPQNAGALFKSARKNAFERGYSAAREKYHQAYLVYKSSGDSRWTIVNAELHVALMRAAEFEGCPQSITARITQELSRFLMRERQYYIQQPDSIEMRKILTALKLSARFWCRVLVQQRAIQLWEPILGPGHLKIMQLHENIANLEALVAVDIDKAGQLEVYETSVNEGIHLSDLAYSPSVDGLLHLEDGSPDDLLKKFEALEKSDITGRQLRQELADLRYGRSRSMLGGYYSFLGRYDDAEKAFQDGIHYMRYETCTEIKLHRIMWYAEHKTRTGNWEDMRNLLVEAHTVFMENDKPSDFIITHFPHRFKILCIAASERAPIDRFANEPENSSVFEHLQPEMAPTPIRQDPESGRISSPTQMSSHERLFPLTPRGFNSVINVDAWRQFVEFSPME